MLILENMENIYIIVPGVHGYILECMTFGPGLNSTKWKEHIASQFNARP